MYIDKFCSISFCKSKGEIFVRLPKLLLKSTQNTYFITLKSQMLFPLSRLGWEKDNELNRRSPLWKNGTNIKAVFMYYWVVEHVTEVSKQPHDVLERQQSQVRKHTFCSGQLGLLLIGHGKYLAFGTDQPLPVVHIKHTYCLSAQSSKCVWYRMSEQQSL